jgi:hypothetical protein
VTSGREHGNDASVFVKDQKLLTACASGSLLRRRLFLIVALIRQESPQLGLYSDWAMGWQTEE